ncbi:retrovirus-related pol polyprotein from transposon TNT 1-94 [Tanacetum coccineum]
MHRCNIDLVTGLPKFKYHKDHLCPSCEQGKSKRASHPPKPVPNSKQRSKNKPPEVIKTFLKRITVLLQSPVIIIRTDNGTEFKNQILKEYFDSVGISHQASSVRTPQQNGAEVIDTVCYTQNRSIIHRRINKTPYELINGRKPYISFLHVFRALYYPKNNHEDIGKLGAKGDIGFFIGYSADSCAYRVYNRRTKKIMETMNVTFDELSAMAFEQSSSKPGLHGMTYGQISSGLDLTYAPSTITTQQPTEGELDLLFEAMYDDYIGGQPLTAPRTTPAAQAPLDVDELETQQQHVQQQENQAPLQPEIVADNVLNAMFEDNTFVNPFAIPSTSAAESSSSQYADPSNMHTFYQKQGIGFKKIKACFVCKSTDHLIKDCDFHDKQSQEPKLKTVGNTGPRVDKPVWDNTKRVNHQKISKYPHFRKTFIPSRVLTRTGLITPVKQNEKRAVHKVSTARPVSTDRPVITAGQLVLLGMLVLLDHLLQK